MVGIVLVGGDFLGDLLIPGFRDRFADLEVILLFEVLRFRRWVFIDDPLGLF